MRTLVALMALAGLAACGQPQQHRGQEPYSASSSPDSRGRLGYSENPTRRDQQQGESSGRGSAATGASGQNLGDLPAGDMNAAAQPEQTP